MRVWSDALEDGGKLPVRYRRDGDNTSPPLSWSDVPEGAREPVRPFENVTPQSQEPFAHWLVYAIARDSPGLPAGFKYQRPQGARGRPPGHQRAGQPRAAGLRGQDKADYPDTLQAEFRGRRFAGEDVHLLDLEGVEFILVGARRRPTASSSTPVPRTTSTPTSSAGCGWSARATR